MYVSVVDHTYSIGQLAKNSWDLTNGFHSLAMNIWSHSAQHGMQGIWWRLGMLEWYVQQKSLAFQISVQWFIFPPLDVFLALEPSRFPKGRSVAVSNCMHCFHLILCVLHPGIWLKVLPFVVGCLSVHCRIIPSLLPICNLFSKIKLVLGKDVQQSVLCHCKIPNCGESCVHLYPQK